MDLPVIPAVVLRYQLWGFLLLWLAFRYARLLINLIVVYVLYRPVPIPDSPTYASHDVTAIIPTIAEDADELSRTIASALEQGPKEVIVVTVDSLQPTVRKTVQALPSRGRISVESISHANKRLQICKVLPRVTTKFTLLLDDDVLLPPAFMDWSLAPFEDPNVGGVGTNQSLKRRERRNFWDFLGSTYLERRNFDCTACNWLDGGLPCLSGRAVMYCTQILQDPEFMNQFTNEKWRSPLPWSTQEYRLNTDDDNFITRWLFSHGRKIQFQSHPECEVQTSLESNPKFIKQCNRWIRSNWRSNLTSLFVEKNVWRLFPYSTYAVFMTTLTHWSLVSDVLGLYLLRKAIKSEEGWSSSLSTSILFAYLAIFWFTPKWIKFCGYYGRYPSDIKYIPFHALFGYVHMFLKFYGMATMHVTSWGSRDHADHDNSIRMRRVERTAFEGGSASEKGEHYEKANVLVYRPASKVDCGNSEQ